MEPDFKNIKYEIMFQDKQEAQGPHRSPESYWLNISHIVILFFIMAPTAMGP
jgi:hypothetical protein